MQNLFLIIGIILIIATLFGILSRFFRQPLILAYIATGLVLGPLVFNKISSSETITTFAQIGVAFLLFIVGLELNFKTLREVGFLALILGISQVLVTGGLAFLLSFLLGFSFIHSLYLALALTFSSTIIVVKFLADRTDLETFYGKISVGILIIQDLIALLILIFLTGLQTNIGNAGPFFTLIKGLVFFFAVFLFSKFVLPALFRFVAKSQEQLFLTSIAWCFFLATTAAYLGFTIEIGAFLAGLSLAVLPYHHDITSKIAQLRDFFLVIFFVNLGLQITIPSFQTILLPTVIFILFVLIGKPVIIQTLVGFFGYRKRTGFFVGTSLAQISEFSLILATLGISIGHITPSIASIITLTGIATITLSSYLISFNHTIYNRTARFLTFFERKNAHADIEKINQPYDTILFGCYRLGSSILDYLHKNNHRVLVVDFNPDVIRKMERKKIPCIYADAGDHALLEDLDLTKVKLIISTIPAPEDTKTLLHYINRKNKNIMTIVTTNHPNQAVELYNEGASYVIIPHLLSGEIVVQTIKDAVQHRKNMKRSRMSHLRHLSRFVGY